jgi:ABC-2 type transport system ATP-binding protein
MTSESQAIQLTGVSKSYGSVAALRSVDLTVRHGEVFGLLGPNGAGKSTTLRIILGMQRPDAGSVLVEGFDTERSGLAIKRLVGYVPDVPEYESFLRGWEILEFVGRVHGLPLSSIRERAEPILHRLGLTQAAHEFAADYSTGMKKKLAIACAVISDPKVLVLDEPTSTLDPASTKLVRDWLTRLASRGKAVVISTHTLDMAERLCDRVAIISQGSVLAIGTVPELLEAHAGSRSLEDVFLALTQNVAGRESG